MSVACPTTQSRSAARKVSEQMPQSSAMVKNPQSGQGRTVSRVVAIERAIVSGWSPRAWTIQSAIRSAERGPIPGIWRSCAINSRIAVGYSVFLKTGEHSLVQRSIGQLEGERFQAPQIQLQGPVLFSFRSARILKLRIGFGPPFFPVKHDAVPERIAPGDDIARSVESQGDRLVNLVPLADIHAAEKIDRTRHQDLAGQLEGPRPEQNPRAVKAARDTKTPGQFHRL